MLRIAIQTKGRLNEQSMGLLREAGITIKEEKRKKKDINLMEAVVPAYITLSISRLISSIFKFTLLSTNTVSPSGKKQYCLQAPNYLISPNLMS